MGQPVSVPSASWPCLHPCSGWRSPDVEAADEYVHLRDRSDVSDNSAPVLEGALPPATEVEVRVLDALEAAENDIATDGKVGSQNGGLAENVSETAMEQLGAVGKAEEILPEQDRLLRKLLGADAAKYGAFGPPRLDAYVREHSSTFDALRAMESDAGWHLKRRTQGVDIFTRHAPDKPVACFKGRTTVSLSPKQMLEALLRMEERPQWDPMCMRLDVLESTLPLCMTFYSQVASPFPPVVCHRDVIMTCRLCIEDDGSVIAAFTSTEAASRPPNSSFVRCNVIIGGYVMRPTAAGGCTVLYAGCVDAMGWLPSWVKDFVAWEQALTLARLKDWCISQQLA